MGVKSWLAVIGSAIGAIFFFLAGKKSKENETLKNEIEGLKNAQEKAYESDKKAYEKADSVNSDNVVDILNSMRNKEADD